MTVCGNPLARSLLGVKRTSLFATHMSVVSSLNRHPVLVVAAMNAEWEWLRPACKRNRIELQLDAKGNP